MITIIIHKLLLSPFFIKSLAQLMLLIFGVFLCLSQLLQRFRNLSRNRSKVLLKLVVSFLHFTKTLVHFFLLFLHLFLKIC